MSDSEDWMSGAPARGEWVRLRTLVNLRWIALGGQLLALLAAVFLFDLELPVDLCLLVIVASAAFNTSARLLSSASTRLQQRGVILTLLFDLVQLTLLLFMTGGLNNPFALLIVVPAVVSATALTRIATLMIAAATAASISLLAFAHMPLRTASGEALQMPALLIYGMWTSLLISVGFLSFYARRITGEIYSMSEALTATRLALEREQKLTALGGVVAAAAHELGTPLATIKLVSAELADELAASPELQADAQLIRDQANRCRDILASMGRMGKEDLLVRHAPIHSVVMEAAEPHLNRGIVVTMRMNGAPAAPETPDQPQIPRRPEIIHGMRNLVQNAVDFARSRVWIDISWTDQRIRVAVADDGAGFPPDLLGRIGDPFVRGRGNDRAAGRTASGYEGMGLGLFIAKTLLERTGAALTFVNGGPAGEGPDGTADGTADGGRTGGRTGDGRPSGAIVELVWRRAMLEASRAETRGPLGFNRQVTE
jgi:two-component system sensor histidine kinase RegB